MAGKISNLYTPYFFNQTKSSSYPTNWAGFTSSQGDFDLPLSSQKVVDFSATDGKIVRLKTIISASLTFAAFSYRFYLLVEPIIRRLNLPFLGEGIALFWPKQKVVECVSKYMSYLPYTFMSKVTEENWLLVLKKIAYIGAFYITSKYIIKHLIMMNLYPAQNRIRKIFNHRLSTKESIEKGKVLASNLSRDNFVVRQLVLEKNGTKYSGLLIGHANLINNGQWVLQATGNDELIEEAGENFARTYNNWEYNTLLVQGPGVGRSEGYAVPETMGNAQEVGLRFLETLGAKKIIIAGRCLGGAAIAQAILNHKFKKNVEYTVIRQMTFDSVSNFYAKTIGCSIPFLGWFVSNLVCWAGCEIDSVKASKKLQDLKIREIIVQASKGVIEQRYLTSENFQSDGVVPAEASLAYALFKQKITDLKLFKPLVNAPHAIPCAQMDLRQDILTFSGNKEEEVYERIQSLLERIQDILERILKWLFD